MELHNFSEMMAMNSSLGKKCTMAVAGAGIPSAIDAVLDAYDNQVADAILVGEPEVIRSPDRPRRTLPWKSSNRGMPISYSKAWWKPQTCSVPWSKRKTD